MGKPSGYRGEQMRVLRRGLVRRIAIGLAAWTVLFAVWAAAIDTFVAPRVADAVSSLCPWVAVSAEEAGLEDTVWYEGSLERTRNTMISCYAAMLASDQDAYAEASDNARAIADALARAQQDAVQAQGAAAGEDAAAQDAAPRGQGGTDAGAASQDSAAQGAEGGANASAEDVATGEGGFATGQSAFSQGQDAPAASDSLQDAATGATIDAGSTHEYRPSSDTEDAIVADATAAMDEPAKEALFEEACAALGTTPSSVRIESPWSAEQSRALWNEIYYADGHMEYRDLQLYDTVRALRLPAAILFYLVGAAVVVWFALSWLTRCFARLFDAVEALFSGFDDELDLPRELDPTARELKELRRRHDDAERAALAAEQRKNELVAYLAHDIRTPLTSIVGYLTLLAEAPDMPEEQRSRYAQVALDRSYRLESMMEEFFEITRYNLSSIPIERQRFDAALLCRQVADEFYPSAQARSIDIDVQADEPLMCFADAEKVSRVLNNLLKNAVAYADEESTVVVRARREEAPACDGEAGHDGESGCGAAAAFLAIDVENQGREIGPEHLQAIFEKFYREDGARSTEGGGAGLGLAIAREIARAHGGDLAAHSIEGRTTFTLRVPA